jgi:hypothetical protein
VGTIVGTDKAEISNILRCNDNFGINGGGVGPDIQPSLPYCG